MLLGVSKVLTRAVLLEVFQLRSDHRRADQAHFHPERRSDRATDRNCRGSFPPDTKAGRDWEAGGPEFRLPPRLRVER